MSTDGAGLRSWRGAIVGTTWCVVTALACLVSLLAGWVRFGLLDPDRYVATVREMARDEVVLDDVRRTVVESIDAAVDQEQGLRAVLPAPLEGLAVTGAGLVRDALDEAVGRVLRSQVFEEVWARAARSAHSQLAGLLTGDGESETSVMLDLSPIFSAVGEGLRVLGVDLAERVGERLFLRYELVGTDRLESTRDVVDVLEAAAVWLPPLTVLSGVGGVALARNRRRALRVLGLAAASAGVAGLALGAWARAGYLEGRPEDALPAAGRVFDIFTEAPRGMAAALVATGLAAVVAASPTLLAAVRAAVARRSRTSTPTATIAGSPTRP